MLDEALLFIYSTAAAVILIAVVAHYYMPTLVGAAQAQAEYVALRNAAPTFVLAQDGSRVHICINSTVPQRVLVQRFGIWVDAQKNCRINPGGQCVSAAEASHGAPNHWPFCRWYLGTYKPGDSVAIVLRGNYAAVAKNYTVAAIPVRR